MTAALTGLIGYPVSHSLSPRIHDYWIAEAGLDAQYKLFTTPPPRLRQTILHLRKKNLKGFNVTVPHKESVIPYLDGLDDAARTIGAVNTVTHENGRLIGSNTDGYGFKTNVLDALGDVSDYRQHALVLGAGGAARAVLWALAGMGVARITLTNRTAEKAAQLAAEFQCATVPWEGRDKALRDVTMLVNTTSLGMISHHLLTLDVKQLPRDAAVCDIVYAPLETELLKSARRRGLRTVDGLGMLLYQAQGAFAMWHGVTPEVTAKLRQHVAEPAA